MQSDDVNHKGVAAFLGILSLTLVMVYAALTAMWRALENNARESDQQTLLQGPPAAVGASRPYFPAPREQPDPGADLAALRAREDAELNSYGWIDRTGGIVRIPIDRAIDLLSQPTKEHP